MLTQARYNCLGQTRRTLGAIGTARLASLSIVVLVTLVCVHVFWLEVPEEDVQQRAQIAADTPGTVDEQPLADGNAPADLDSLAPVEHAASVQGVDEGVARELLVFGRVSDVYDHPIADVSVSTGTRQATTNADGVYRLPVVSADYYFSLVFLRSGYKEQRVTITRAQTEAADEIEQDAVLFTAPDTTSVTGFLRDEHGRAIENQRVKLFSLKGARFYSALTDTYGEFRLQGVRTGPNYSLEVAAEPSYQHYLSDGFDVTESTPALEIVLHQAHYGGLSGTVVDSDGVPVPGFLLQVRSSAASGRSYPVTSDASGYFELDAVPAGTLEVIHRGNPYFKLADIPLTPAARQVISVRLDTGQHSVEGWVVDHFGTALAGVRVTLTQTRAGQGLGLRSNRWSSSGGDGHFRFDRIGAGAYDLTAQAKGYARQATAFVVGRDSDPIRIALLPVSP